MRLVMPQAHCGILSWPPALRLGYNTACGIRTTGPTYDLPKIIENTGSGSAEAVFNTAMNKLDKFVNVVEFDSAQDIMASDLISGCICCTSGVTRRVREEALYMRILFLMQ